MWSGLLPAGVNQSDVDTNSDDEETVVCPVATLKEESEEKASDFEIGRPESITESKPVSAAVADEVQEFQACPSGVSLDMWDVGLIITLHMTDTEA